MSLKEAAAIKRSAERKQNKNKPKTAEKTNTLVSAIYL